MAERKVTSGSLKRRKGRTRSIRKILIVCEGKRTEPNYFRAFPGKPDVYDALDVHGMGMNTVSLVEKAIELKMSAEKRGEQYIEVWVVFDKDEFPWTNFERAIRIARENNIFLAYSIESFELWYLLHYRFSESRLSRSDYCSKLSDVMGEPYDKNDPDMFRKLQGRMNTAIQNASRLYERNGSKPVQKQDPITLVYRLVQRLV